MTLPTIGEMRSRVTINNIVYSQDEYGGSNPVLVGGPGNLWAKVEYSSGGVGNFAGEQQWTQGLKVWVRYTENLKIVMKNQVLTINEQSGDRRYIIESTEVLGYGKKRFMLIRCSTQFLNVTT